MGEFPNKSTQFSSTNQPSNNGRKPKIYTVLKEKGYSKEDITTAFGEIAWYTEDELNEVYDDKDLPIITRIVAAQYTKALQKFDWSKIKEIMEHVIGKPNQKIEADIADGRASVKEIFPKAE